MSMYYVYFLKCADNTYYAGITTNLERREKEHNSSNKGAKYTKARRPVHIVYSEQFLDRSSATTREYYLKKLSRNDKENLIHAYTASNN